MCLTPVLLLGLFTHVFMDCCAKEYLFCVYKNTAEPKLDSAVSGAEMMLLGLNAVILGGVADKTTIGICCAGRDGGVIPA